MDLKNELYLGATFRVQSHTGWDYHEVYGLGQYTVETTTGKKFSYREIQGIPANAAYLSSFDGFLSKHLLDITYNEDGRNWQVRDASDNFITTFRFVHEFNMLMYLLTGEMPEQNGY